MNQPNIILYAEDDEDDVMLLQNAFKKYNGDVELRVVGDGAEALQYLRNIEQEQDLPCLIILDINMPGMDGRQALTYLKTNDRFKHLPVIIFTTSSSPLDKQFAAKWGVDLITKPITTRDLSFIAERFVEHCKGHRPQRQEQ